MQKQKKPESILVYQMKVAIMDITPAVWRRFLITSDQTLHNLHLILQTIMGWGNYHLYRFVADDIVYGQPDYDYEPGVESAEGYRLSNIVRKERQKLLYVYDYGDNWRHEIEIEKILPPEPNVYYPVCIAGENACPPEDCGGVSGYADMLEIIKDKENDEYEDMIAWLGAGFDPAAFDLASVNKELIRNASQWQAPLTLCPSDNSGFLGIPPIDRLIAIIKPKEPLLKWLQSQPDWDVDMTLDGLMSYCMAILIPLFDSEKEALRYVERNHRKIFMMILDDWYRDPDVWPKISLRLFRQWFSVEIHTIVFDMVNKPIRKLGEPEEF